MNNIDSQSFIAGQPNNNPEPFNENASKDTKNFHSSLKNKIFTHNKQQFINLVLGSASKTDDVKHSGKFSESVKQSGSATIISAQASKRTIVTLGKNNLSAPGCFAEELPLVKKGVVNSAKQAVGSKEKKLDVELSAFATYKLSYIDRLPDKMLTSKILNSEKIHNTDAHINDFKMLTPYISTNNGVKFGVATQELATKYLENVDLVENPTKAVSAEHLMQYEKYKISLIGEEQKILLIRDYGNNLELDSGDIKKLFVSHLEKLSTIILNGKEI
ncbi:hypothetical protein GCM10011613_32460 [Cellvibrio zantedeschiae]|uniref:Uncharacterized protein n=1 Tax=Cellvibrio zantedeschiae TaxID=1237077 RepID=A0ABQ3B8X2_9GAMM|nr:hypothetical protein [Cellvibrio zantedeschiae]GGY84900.1 hypothetical protein GCM10011613_32460 [Cellvibrio zantedeschiae]